MVVELLHSFIQLSTRFFTIAIVYLLNICVVYHPANEQRLFAIRIIEPTLFTSAQFDTEI